jgi:hypothetical protein
MPPDYRFGTCYAARFTASPCRSDISISRSALVCCTAMSVAGSVVIHATESLSLLAAEDPATAFAAREGPPFLKLITSEALGGAQQAEPDPPPSQH